MRLNYNLPTRQNHASNIGIRRCLINFFGYRVVPNAINPIQKRLRIFEKRDKRELLAKRLAKDG